MTPPGSRITSNAMFVRAYTEITLVGEPGGTIRAGSRCRRTRRTSHSESERHDLKDDVEACFRSSDVTEGGMHRFLLKASTLRHSARRLGWGSTERLIDAPESLEERLQ